MQIATIAGADKVDAGATELGRVFAGPTWGMEKHGAERGGREEEGEGEGGGGGGSGSSLQM